MLHLSLILRSVFNYNRTTFVGKNQKLPQRTEKVVTGEPRTNKRNRAAAKTCSQEKVKRSGRRIVMEEYNPWHPDNTYSEYLRHDCSTSPLASVDYWNVWRSKLCNGQMSIVWDSLNLTPCITMRNTLTKTRKQSLWLDIAWQKCSRECGRI